MNRLPEASGVSTASLSSARDLGIYESDAMATCHVGIRSHFQYRGRPEDTTVFTPLSLVDQSRSSWKFPQSSDRNPARRPARPTDSLDPIWLANWTNRNWNLESYTPCLPILLHNTLGFHACLAFSYVLLTFDIITARSLAIFLTLCSKSCHVSPTISCV